MEPDQFQQRVDALFTAAAALPHEERAKFLDLACANDPPEVRAAVERLLANDQAAQADSGFLRKPPLADLASPLRQALDEPGQSASDEGRAAGQGKRQRDVHSAEADRNLFFGIIALQMDFVSNDQLVAAMHAWVLSKSTPLGEIMLQQRALRSSDRDMLQAMVNRHIELHQNDPEQSLASLSSIGSLRQELASLGDVDVEGSLAQVSAARVEDPDRTASWSVGDSTSKGERFRVLRPHSKGALGEVFVARDSELNREVALKQIQEWHADNPASRARFVLEGEITGGLEHPGIVPVYGLGHDGKGRPFYAMRFIKGHSLQEAIKQFHERSAGNTDAGQRALEFRGLLGRFMDVCNAVAYAHSRGVLHRDLKPGNVMLGDFGETLVVDWGLAKVVGRSECDASSDERTLRPSAEAGSTPTQTGQALGTLPYMSPEQVAGRLDDLGPTSDVYSLGATLYSLLTGNAPFDSQDPEIMRKVQQGQFQRPRQANPKVPHALEAVCLMAMALRQPDRYQNPRQLANEVSRWLADEPVSAHPETVSARAARFGRKHRGVVLAGMASALFMAIGATVAALLIDIERRANSQLAKTNFDLAQQARQAANEARRQMHQVNARSLAAHSRATRMDFPIRSVLLALEAVKATSRHVEPVHRDVKSELRAALSGVGGVPLAWNDGVRSLAFSSGGRWLAIGTDKKDVRVFNMTNGELPTMTCKLILQDVGPARHLAMTEDGRCLAAASDNRVSIWNLSRGGRESVATQRTEFFIDGTASTRWHSLLPLVSGLKIAGTEVQLEATAAKVSCLAISPGGHHLAVGGDDGRVWLWNDAPETSNVDANPHILNGNEGRICAIRFSPNGKRLVSLHGGTTSFGRSACVWDLHDDGANPSQPPKLMAIDESSGCSMSTDGRWLVNLKADGKIELWDLALPTPVAVQKELSFQKDQIADLHWLGLSPAGRWLVTGFRRGPSKLWDLEASGVNAQGTLLSESSDLMWGVFSADGHWFATMTLIRDKAARLYDLTRKDVLSGCRVLRAHDATLSGLRISPDGRWLVTVDDRTARAWPLLRPGACEPRMLSDSGGYVSSDGHWLATGDSTTVRVWDVEKSDAVFSKPIWECARGPFHGYKFAMNSSKPCLFVMDSDDGTLGFLDLAALERNPDAGVQTLFRGPIDSSTVMISSGRWLAIGNGGERVDILGGRLRGSSDDRVRIWDIADGGLAAEPKVLTLHTNGLRRLAFSPDDRWLAASGYEGRVELWNLANPTATSRMLTGHSDFVWCLAFSPDRRWLLTGSDDKTARVWDLSHPDAAATAILRGHTGRIAALVVSPDGQVAVTTSNDGTARVWKLGKFPGGKPKILRHEAEVCVYSAAISPDARWLATGAGDGMIRLWDLESPDGAGAWETLKAHSDAVWQVQFTPDGSRLISADDDGLICLWHMRLRELIETARRTVGRELTDEERVMYAVPSD